MVMRGEAGGETGGSTHGGSQSESHGGWHGGIDGAVRGEGAGAGRSGDGGASRGRGSSESSLRDDHRGLITLNVLLFFGSGVFAIAAVWFAFRAYFSLTGETPNPTADDLAGIDVCAAISVLAAVGSVVVAVIIRGRWGVLFGSLSGAALVGAVIVAALITAPQGLLRPTPAPAPDLPSNYQPCYSGSNACN